MGGCMSTPPPNYPYSKDLLARSNSKKSGHSRRPNRRDSAYDFSSPFNAGNTPPATRPVSPFPPPSHHSQRAPLPKNDSWSTTSHKSPSSPDEKYDCVDSAYSSSLASSSRHRNVWNATANKLRFNSDQRDMTRPPLPPHSRGSSVSDNRRNLAAYAPRERSDIDWTAVGGHQGYGYSVSVASQGPTTRRPSADVNLGEDSWRPEKMFWASSNPVETAERQRRWAAKGGNAAADPNTAFGRRMQMRNEYTQQGFAPGEKSVQSARPAWYSSEGQRGTNWEPKGGRAKPVMEQQGDGIVELDASETKGTGELGRKNTVARDVELAG